MGIIITSTATELKVDFDGEHVEMKCEIIRLSNVIGIDQSTDNKSIDITFSSGEIQKFDYNKVDEIDGDSSITSQAILWTKIKDIIFP